MALATETQHAVPSDMLVISPGACVFLSLDFIYTSGADILFCWLQII
jgi:hypothetical protein